MLRTALRAVLLLLVLALLGGLAAGESDSRRVKVRVEPTYPELARQSHVSGVVRIEIVVDGNGTVKSTKALGGHPLLVQSAEQAVRKWRYEPGPEATMIIEFRFNEN